MSEKILKNWLGLLNLQGHPSDENVRKICDDIRERWYRHQGNRVEFSYRVKRYCGHYPVFNEKGCFIKYLKATIPEEIAKVPADLYHIHIAFYGFRVSKRSLVERYLGYDIEAVPASSSLISERISTVQNNFLESDLPHEEIIFKC